MKTLLFASMLLLAGCVSHPSNQICGPNDHVIRYSSAQIDAMTDAQVTDNLARNEELERRGCAVAN